MTMVIGFRRAAAGLMGAGSAPYSPGNARGTGFGRMGRLWCRATGARPADPVDRAPPLTLLAPLLRDSGGTLGYWLAGGSRLAEAGLCRRDRVAWCLLLVGPARTLAMSAEIRFAPCAPVRLVGAVAGWPLVAAACVGAGRSPGCLGRLATAGSRAGADGRAGIDWPFPGLPAAGPGVLLAAGLAAGAS